MKELWGHRVDSHCSDALGASPDDSRARRRGWEPCGARTAMPPRPSEPRKCASSSSPAHAATATAGGRRSRRRDPAVGDWLLGKMKAGRLQVESRALAEGPTCGSETLVIIEGS
jgi:hypothetical protein